MKCKVFNSNRNNLEEEVNLWLDTGKYEISNILQTEGDHGYVTMTIFYLDLKEIRNKKLLKIKNSNT